MTDIWKLIAADTMLSSSTRGIFIEQFGKRGKKALTAIDEERVKKYLDFFVVVGYRDEYVVDDHFCTCGDFLYRGGECTHILAVKMARITGHYENYDSWYYPSLRR